VVALAESNLRASGQASLEVELVHGESTVTSSYATNPMKLLTTCARGQCVQTYLSSFGGGLVGGDETFLDVRLGPGTRCLVGTQASTKVYRNPKQRPCGHFTNARLGSASLFVLAPDPVQPFAESRYIQRQQFHLAANASLVLLDWFSSGRSARGERWAFSHFATRNEIFIGGASALLDSLRLNPEDGDFNSRHRNGRFDCFATFLLVGPLLREVASRVLQDVAAQPVLRRAPVVRSASPFRDGVLLRVAGEQVETVARQFGQIFTQLTALLGEDPWLRKG